jgi:hypothetical protein
VCAALLLVTIGAVLDSWETLVLFLLAADFVISAIEPACNWLLVRSVPTGQQGLAFGMKQAANPLAASLSGLAVPVLGMTVGWRWAFALVGLLAALAAVTLTLCAVTQVERRGRRPQISVCLSREPFSRTAGWGWNGLFNFAVVGSHLDAPALATSITHVGARLARVAGPLLFGAGAVRASYARCLGSNCWMRAGRDGRHGIWTTLGERGGTESARRGNRNPYGVGELLRRRSCGATLKGWRIL